ncbi:hypothetical protein BDA99DRAFT_170706 [Phascolomyces articulosus]|uniref:Uncharacterized protein n=1 Tax=Phascolomyces articulosus TaxID=60185 RepID=A0AAD5PC68_9FUNG|nr:hypothetical protein BDA99DRAFT_170706 [Phascolomyces articulosus]
MNKEREKKERVRQQQQQQQQQEQEQQGSFSGQKRKPLLGQQQTIQQPVSKQPRIEYDEEIELPLLPIPPSKTYDYSHSPPVVPNSDYVTYQEPYYSNPADVPGRPKVFSGKEFRLTSKSVQHLKPVPPTYFSKSENAWKHSTMTEWELAIQPPSPSEIRQWLYEKEQQQQKQERQSNKTVEMDIDKATTTSQLDGPSTFDFQLSLSKPKSNVTRARDYLDILSVEIHGTVNI